MIQFLGEDKILARLLSRRKLVPGKEPTDCWVWQGVCNHSGYGRIRINGKLKSVHRVSYEGFRSYIPIGLEVDHICSNRSCFNPDHLEAVTHAVNVSRGRHWNIEKTACSNGHEFTDESYVWNFRKEKMTSCLRRVCKICKRERYKKIKLNAQC